MDELEMKMLGTLSKEEVRKVLSRMSYKKREELAGSKDLKYCGKVCYEVLAKDPDRRVRSNLASNPTLGEYCRECMLEFTDDPDDAVRLYLAHNPV